MIVSKVRIVVPASGERTGLYGVDSTVFLDLHGSYRGVCFITINSAVRLCFRDISYISQHHVFLNNTTFSFVFG